MRESRREELTTDILRDIRRAEADTRILQGMRRQYLRRVAGDKTSGHGRRRHGLLWHELSNWNSGMRALAAGLALVAGLLLADAAVAQKPGGILRVYHRDSPASMSIHEEATNSVSIPMMAVFNNLVLADHVLPCVEPYQCVRGTLFGSPGVCSFRPRQARSKRSAFITLFQAATKSPTNFTCASAEP